MYWLLILVFICIKLMKWYLATFVLFIGCLNTFCCEMPIQIFFAFFKIWVSVLFLLICKRFLYMMLGKCPIIERSDPLLWQERKEKLTTGAAGRKLSMLCALF